MNASFVNRRLRATLVLPQGTFPGTNSDTLVLENFRMSARLTAAGNWTNFCDLQVYGMRQADMSAVSVLFGQGGTLTEINARALLVLESHDGSGWLQVFEGQFQQAQADYSAMPDVRLSANAATGAGQQYLMAQPSSFSGTVNAASVAAALAQAMGFAFENNGVTATLNAPYLPGTLMDQFRALARAARFDYYFDARSTLIICPPNAARQNKDIVVVNSSSGLIGYPTLAQYGIDIDVLFTPAIELGSPLFVSGSQVPGADGLWFPRTATHELQSVTPGGRWFSHLECSPNLVTAPAP